MASDGVIYVGDARGSLHAFDARTGAIAWTYDTKSSIFGVPALDGEALLVLDSRDVVHRIEMKSGKRIWARVLGNGRPHDVPSPKSRQFDYRSAMPALHDGTAYVGTGSGTFYALDAARGSVVWQQRMGHAIRSTAAVAGGRAIFGTWDGNVVALDLKTGESAWKLATGQPISMAVVVYKNVAIVGSRNTLLYGIDIGSGKPVWKRYYFTSWIESAPTIVDGIAYMGSSDLHALRVRSAHRQHVVADDRIRLVGGHAADRGRHRLRRYCRNGTLFAQHACRALRIARRRRFAVVARRESARDRYRHRLYLRSGAVLQHDRVRIGNRGRSRLRHRLEQIA